ncbi:hypothetical protein RMATCC62417_10290 [Rhizopus microsporus]|nr:hypothetical protein RMATCC62417_10290 [Rhizopus microsporus]
MYLRDYHKIRFKERRRTNTELADIPRFIVKPKTEYLKHRKHPTSELALQPLNDVFITKPKNDNNNETMPKIPLKRAIDALEDDISDQPDDLIESVSARSKMTHELQDTKHEQLNQVENTQEIHPTQDTVQSDTIPQEDIDIEKQTVRSSSFSEKELTDVESLAYTQTIDSQSVRDSMMHTQDELGEEQLEDEEMMEVTHLKPDELKEIEQAMDVQVGQTEMQLEANDEQIKQTEADDDQSRQLEVDDDIQAEQTEIQLEIEQKETEIVETEQLEMEDTKHTEEETKDELVRDDAQSAYGYDGMELLNNDALADEQPIASPISKLSEEKGLMK